MISSRLPKIWALHGKGVGVRGGGVSANCRSPDFKSLIGLTKNLERHYNRVVVCSGVWSQRWL